VQLNLTYWNLLVQVMLNLSVFDLLHIIIQYYDPMQILGYLVISEKPITLQNLHKDLGSNLRYFLYINITKIAKF
jgi:hypothetical protein